MKKRFLRLAAVLSAAALLCSGTASAAENDAQKTELYKYLAELDSVSLDECIILKDEFLTPNIIVCTAALLFQRSVPQADVTISFYT